MVSITKERQSSESPAQTAERNQSSPAEGLAIVTYIFQPQYARSIILELKAIVEISMMEETHHVVNKEKVPAVFESQCQADALSSPSKEMSSLPKAADEVHLFFSLFPYLSLFTSWEQVKVSSAPYYSFVTHPSTSSIPSTEDVNALKRVVLAYTSFMDKDISRSSADSQKELLAYLSEDLADALKRLFLEILASIRLTLRGIHQEVSLLLSKNMEWKVKKTTFFQAMVEKKSLSIDINSAKSKLDELSSEVMIEDSLLIRLEFEMKKLKLKLMIAR
ncbi:Uncharacterized protein Adt_11832 [Abeliophyllum distichum]|uniref:Uncharacterized protein n=1 Tax=Abeliophyllum distichum TaxID=126358 RepID=A0ABD1UPV5_9LAMI